MNNVRRMEINKWNDELVEIRDAIEALKDEEQEYYDNMPEAFQNGEKGDSAQTAIIALDNACACLEEVSDYLNEAVEA